MFSEKKMVEKRKSIVLSKIEPFEKEDFSLILKQLKERGYSENDSFGYTNVEANNRYIYAKLLKRIPTYINEYKNNQIERKCIFLIDEIEFSLDIEYKFVEIYSSQKNAQKVKDSLRKIFKSRYSFESIQLFAHELIPNFNAKYSTKISSLKINSFLYTKNIYGVFNAIVGDNKKALELIKKYKTDIKKITFQIEIDDKIIDITLNDYGSVSFISNEYHEELILDFIKKNIKKYNARG